MRKGIIVASMLALIMAFGVAFEYGYNVSDEMSIAKTIIADESSNTFETQMELLLMLFRRNPDDPGTMPVIPFGFEDTLGIIPNVNMIGFSDEGDPILIGIYVYTITQEVKEAVLAFTGICAEAAEVEFVSTVGTRFYYGGPPRDDGDDVELIYQRRKALDGELSMGSMVSVGASGGNTTLGH